MERARKRTGIESLLAVCLALLFVFHALGFCPVAVRAEQIAEDPGSNRLEDGSLLIRNVAHDSKYYPAAEGGFDPIVRSVPASINLEVRTELKYRRLKAGQFTFRLMDRDHNLISTAVNDADGKVVFDSVGYTELGTYVYFITEVEDTEDDEIIYERGEGVITVTVVPDPTGAPGLIATPDYDPADDSTIPLFSNSVNTDTILGVLCLVNGGTPATEGRQFGFTVEFDFQDGDGAEHDFAWEKVKLGKPMMLIGQGRIGSGGTFTLGHNEAFAINALPFGTSYTIKESVPEGFELNATGAEGKLGRNSRVYIAEFVNSYSVKGELQLAAEVSLEGRDPVAGEFTFELTDAGGKVVSRAANDRTGKVIFPAIGFTGADMVDDDGNPISAKRYDYTVRQVIPASPEKGYTYDDRVIGAAVDVTDNGEGALLVSVTYGGDTVFRNTYEAPVHTVTVSCEGSGTAAASPASGAAGTEVTLTASPESGWRFKEWKVVSGGVSVTGDKITVGDADAEIRAVFEPIPVPRYTVTFNTNGHGAAPAAQTVEEGATAAKPADLTEDGWTFGGWYRDKSCHTPFDFAAPIEGNLVLYAGWTEVVTYTVTAGGNSIWTRESGFALTFTVKRSADDGKCIDHFTGAEIDGASLVSGADYTAAPGSTVLTLKASALEKLSVGSHTVTVKFDDGECRAAFTVEAAPPATGEEKGAVLWLSLLGVSLIGFACAALPRGKRRTGR